MAVQIEAPSIRTTAPTLIPVLTQSAALTVPSTPGGWLGMSTEVAGPGPVPSVLNSHPWPAVAPPVPTPVHLLQDLEPASQPSIFGHQLRTTEAVPSGQIRNSSEAACTGVAAAASPSAPSPGQTVVVTATSTCPAGTVPEYSYFIRLGSTGVWNLESAWTGPSWAWATGGLALGSYQVLVWVSDGPYTLPQAQGEVTVAVLDGVGSQNWSGYVAGYGPYTSVSGTFTVPSLYQGEANVFLSEWVGIDGAYNSSLIQAGVQEVPDAADPKLFYITPWWEVLPASETTISGLTVAPGDRLTVSISEVTSSSWQITVTDNTNGGFFTTEQPYSGPATSGEWIVEAPTVNGSQTQLAPYTPTTFSALTVGGTASSLTSVYMCQGSPACTVVSVPSSLTASGFAVAYGSSPPPAP